jgi:hypothetical protein
MKLSDTDIATARKELAEALVSPQWWVDRYGSGLLDTINALKANLVRVSAELVDYEQGLTQQLAADRIAELEAENAKLKVLREELGIAIVELVANGYTASQAETIIRGVSQEATIDKGSFAEADDE